MQYYNVHDEFDDDGEDFCERENTDEWMGSIGYVHGRVKLKL